MLLIGWWIAGWERLVRRFVDECVLVSMENFPLGLEPVVELRASLITALDGEFVGSLPDTFFEWERLDQWLFGTGKPWHEEHLWR